MMWYIPDQFVVNLLLKNGFKCSHSNSPIIGAIRIQTQHKKKSQWYESDVPIERNQEYTLPDGSILKSKGTSLEKSRYGR